MYGHRACLKPLVLAILLLLAIPAVFGQNSKRNKSDPVLWSPASVRSRDLYYGPGGRSMQPNTRKITFIKRETGGNNLKYRIKDGSGRIWVAKIADESQPETVAVRIIWALGYRTEINYLVPRLTIPGQGTYTNVRLEARPANVDRQGRWSWTDNPFAGTKELQGLKLMMALINNWDLKTGNNVILQTPRERQYVVSDLGSAFGKLSKSSLPLFNRFGRSVNVPADYADSLFIDCIEDNGEIDLAYKGKAENLLNDITVADGRWTARLLRQLSDKQIRDAFRAANYSPAEIDLLSRAVRQRIDDLTDATGSFVARQ